MKIFKFFKTCIFWAIIGIILTPIILKLDSIAQQDFNFNIVPFAIIGTYWFVLFVITSIKTDSRKKLIFAYISVLPLCLIIGEVWGYVKNSQLTNTQCETQHSGTYGSDYFTPDSITGYKAKPNVHVDSVRKSGNEVIYDVIYTSNDFGYRYTPNSNLDSTHCLLFFGDSFTIGEGLDDEHTLPYFLNQHIHFKVFNFGFHGYGNHQALALLKSGEVARITQGCKSYIAFYESLPGHIQRASGFSAWEDLNAPRFKYTNNTLIWTNEYKTFWDKIANKAFLQLKEKSYLFKILRPKYAYSERYNELYFKILEEIDLLLHSQLNTRLHLILWDRNNFSDETEKLESNAIISWLKTKDFRSFLVSDILPKYKQNRLKYGIHTCDLHPNALANELIAKFLAEQIKNGRITQDKSITSHHTNHILQSSLNPENIKTTKD